MWVVMRQASNGHFRLPLASNWSKFYRDASKYPAKLSRFFRCLKTLSLPLFFGEKIAWFVKFSWFFYRLKEKCTFYRHALKITVNVIWQEFLRYPHYYPRISDLYRDDIIQYRVFRSIFKAARLPMIFKTSTSFEHWWIVVSLTIIPYQYLLIFYILIHNEL